MVSADRLPVSLKPHEDGPSIPDAHSPPRPELWRNRLWLHVLLFLLTVLSTTVVGMRYMENFLTDQVPLSSDADVFPYVWVWHHRAAFATGLPFSLTVLAILVAHEFGHFFACRLYKVQVTLPYFLPAPTLSGTAGAILRIRGHVRTRSAMAVIAAAGPISGFLVAIGAIALGLVLSKSTPAPVPQVIQFKPILLHLIDAILRAFRPETATLDRIIPHPVLVASWVGLLITSLNLVPAGQLDGGHILYAVYPRAHRTISFVTIAVLAVLGTFAWVGWFAWAIVLVIPGLKHPRLKEDPPLHPWQRALLPICLVILILCGTLSPFAGTSLVRIFAHH